MMKINIKLGNNNNNKKNNKVVVFFFGFLKERKKVSFVRSFVNDK